MRVLQPANRAGTPSISAVEGRGAVPAGTYRPTLSIGRDTRSQRTPSTGVDDEGLRQLRPVERLDVRGRGTNGRPLPLGKALLGGVELRNAYLQRIQRHADRTAR